MSTQADYQSAHADTMSTLADYQSAPANGYRPAAAGSIPMNQFRKKKMTVIIPPGYKPAASTGYKPAASTGYQPAASTGYKPAASTGYKPTASTGYKPTASTGYKPAASTGYKVRVIIPVVPNGLTTCDELPISDALKANNLDLVPDKKVEELEKRTFKLVRKLGDGTTLTADTVSDWQGVITLTESTNTPFIVACLMAYVSICHGMSIFIDKIQRVCDGTDTNTDRVDIILAMWSNVSGIWKDLTETQKERLTDALKSNDTDSTQMPNHHHHNSVANHRGIAEDKFETRKTFIVPENNSIRSHEPRQARGARDNRSNNEVFENGPKRIGGRGIGVGSKPYIKVESNPALGELLDETKADFDKIMEVTERTRSSIPIAVILLARISDMFAPLQHMVKAIASGVMSSEKLHPAIFAAVALWSDELYNSLEDEEKSRLREIYATDMAAKEARCENNNKNISSAMRQPGRIETMHDVVMILRMSLMALYNRQWFHELLAETHPELVEYLDRFRDTDTTSYRHQECKNKCCKHRKRCHCSKDKCPSKGCKVCVSGGKCERPGYCTKACPKFKCDHREYFNPAALLDLLKFIAIVYPRTLWASLDNYLDSTRYINPIAMHYTPECGLSRGQALLLCFSMQNWAITEKIKSELCSASVLFEQPATWWEKAWKSATYVNGIPYIGIDNFYMLLEEKSQEI